MTKTSTASSRSWGYPRLRIRRGALGSILFANALLFAAAEPALAQSDAPTNPPELAPANDRDLKGHRLLWPQYVDSSVVTTYAGSRTGMIITSVPELPTSVGTRSLKLLGVNQGFDFQFKILDPWSVNLTAGGRAILGSNIASLLYQTGAYDFGGALSTTIRLVRVQSVGLQVAIRPFGSYSTGRVVSMLPLFTSGVAPTIKAILDGTTGEYFTTPLQTYSYGLSAAAALALHPTFSLQGSAALAGQGVRTEPFIGSANARVATTKNGVEYHLGLAAAADFNPLRVPVAVMAEYQLARQGDTTGLVSTDEFDVTHTLALGVYYTGQPQLQLGAVGATQLGIEPVSSEVGRSNTPNRTTVWLVLRHGW